MKMVALPATCVHMNRNNSNPEVAMMSFLPIEDVKNLTNHISAPWVKNYELVLLFKLPRYYKKKNEKRKGKLVFF